MKNVNVLNVIQGSWGRRTQRVWIGSDHQSCMCTCGLISWSIDAQHLLLWLRAAWTWGCYPEIGPHHHFGGCYLGISPGEYYHVQKWHICGTSDNTWMELWLFLKLYLALPKKTLIINLCIWLIKMPSISLFYHMLIQHSELAEVINITHEIMHWKTTNGQLLWKPSKSVPMNLLLLHRAP